MNDDIILADSRVWERDLVDWSIHKCMQCVRVQWTCSIGIYNKITFARGLYKVGGGKQKVDATWIGMWWKFLIGASLPFASLFTLLLPFSRNRFDKKLRHLLIFLKISSVLSSFFVTYVFRSIYNNNIISLRFYTYFLGKKNSPSVSPAIC